MPKNAYFLEKAVKLPHRRGYAPKPPLASGGWEIRSQTRRVVTPAN